MVVWVTSVQFWLNIAKGYNNELITNLEVFEVKLQKCVIRVNEELGWHRNFVQEEAELSVSH